MLSQRERSELDDSVKSVETGKSVMKKLCAALKDVLEQLELKEKVLQKAWLELRDSVDTGSLLGVHSYGFEPDLSPKASKYATFDGISLLASEGKCEEWCSTVIGICERLVAFMSRETHLQKWASVLEKEGTQISKAKEAAKDQRAKAEAIFKSAEEQMSSTEVERGKLNKERENLLLWVAHLQERRKVRIAYTLRGFFTNMGLVVTSMYKIWAFAFSSVLRGAYVHNLVTERQSHSQDRENDLSTVFATLTLDVHEVGDKKVDQVTSSLVINSRNITRSEYHFRLNSKKISFHNVLLRACSTTASCSN